MQTIPNHVACGVFSTTIASSPQRQRTNSRPPHPIFLGLAALLQHFVETKVPRHDDLEAPVASFRAACKVLYTILWCKRGTVSPEDGAVELRASVQEHMAAHLRAHSDVYIKPKHHWTFHIAPQFRCDHAIVDCFVVERGHLLVKSLAEHVRNTSNYERSLMAGVVNQLFKVAEVSRLGSGLRGSVTSCGGTPLSSHMTVLGLQVASAKP